MNAEEEGIARRSVSGVAWSMISAWGGGVVQVLVLLGLSRLLTPEDFGLMTAVLVVVGFGNTFSNLGVGSAVVQLPKLTGNQAAAAFWLSFFLGPVIALTVYVFAEAIASFMRMPLLDDLLRMVSGIFIARAAAIVPQGLLQREIRFRETSIIDFSCYVFVYTPVAFVLALNDFGAASLALAAICQSSAQMVALFVASPLSLGHLFTWKDARPLLAFGGGMSLATFAGYVALNADNVIIGRVLGEAALGAYSRAYRLMMTTASLLTKVVEKVLFAAVSRTGEREAVANGLLATMRVIGLIFIPVGLVAAILAQDIVLIALGPGWDSVILPFSILAVGLVARASYKIGTAFVKAAGLVYGLAWRIALYAVAVTVGSYVAVLHGGIAGVAVAVSAASFFIFILTVQLACRAYGVSYRTLARTFLPGVILGFVASTAAYLTVFLLPNPSYEGALLRAGIAIVFVGVTVSSAVTLLFRFFLGDFLAVRLLAFAAARNGRVAKLVEKFLRRFASA